jgi:hypothetical protein
MLGTKGPVENTKKNKSRQKLMTTDTDTDTAAAPETARPSKAAGLVLFAVIRVSSKYAYQGREGGRVVAMEVEELEPAPSEYPFRLENGNRYRREDLTFYVREEKTGRLVKLR